jgi:hypothetical protein
VTETVLGRIAEAMHVPDLRTLDMQPGPADDREVEGVFESEMGNGVILRLSRVREEDGGAFLELDAIRK